MVNEISNFFLDHVEIWISVHLGDYPEPDRDCWGWGVGWGKKLGIERVQGFPSWGDENVLKLRQMCTSVNILKDVDLYNLNG